MHRIETDGPPAEGGLLVGFSNCHPGFAAFRAVSALNLARKSRGHL